MLYDDPAFTSGELWSHYLYNPAAIGAGKLMAALLFGVDPWDPVMLTLATLLLGLAAFLASAIPAWRAAAVEPMVALRTE